MGAACARMLIKTGRRVIGLDRDGMTVPDGVRFVPVDVTDPVSVESVFAQLQAENVRLDAIAYMAGVYDTDSLIEIDEERMRQLEADNDEELSGAGLLKAAMSGKL